MSRQAGEISVVSTARGIPQITIGASSLLLRPWRCFAEKSRAPSGGTVIPKEKPCLPINSLRLLKPPRT